MSIWDKLKEDAEKAKEQAEKRQSSNNSSDGDKEYAFSITALYNDGEIILRPYIDEKTQSAIRTIKRHKIGQEKVLCLGEGCPIDKAIEDVKSQGYSNAWKFRAIDLCIMKGYLKSLSWSKDSQGNDILMETPTLFLFDWKVRDKFNEFIAGLNAEQIEKLFTPSSEAPFIKISKKGKDVSLGVYNNGFDTVTGTIPELSKEQKDTPLTDLFIPESLVPDEATVGKAVKAIYDIANKALQTKVQDPIPPKEESKEEVEQKQLNSSGKSCFAKHPEGSSPECIRCPEEVDCKKATVSDIEPF